MKQQPRCWAMQRKRSWVTRYNMLKHTSSSGKKVESLKTFIWFIVDRVLQLTGFPPCRSASRKHTTGSTLTWERRHIRFAQLLSKGRPPWLRWWWTDRWSFTCSCKRRVWTADTTEPAVSSPSSAVTPSTDESSPHMSGVCAKSALSIKVISVKLSLEATVDERIFVFLFLDTTCKKQKKLCMNGPGWVLWMYKLPCSFSRNVHCDIHTCLSGWFEQRCPLAYLGCTYSQRRFHPSTHKATVTYKWAQLIWIHKDSFVNENSLLMS